MGSMFLLVLLFNPLSLLIFFTVLIVVIIVSLDRKNKRQQSTLPTTGQQEQASQANLYRDGYYKALQDVTTWSDQNPHRPIKKIIKDIAPDFEDQDAIVSPQIITGLTPAPVVSEPITAIAPATAVEASYRATQKQSDSSILLNITLFIASLLIVAGAVAFIGGTEGVARLLVIWVGVLILYGAGLWLYRAYRQLRPAAVAFIGIGLAVVPFTGILLKSELGIDTAPAWFITSLIATVLYIAAAVVLKSRTIAYISMIALVALAVSASQSFTEELLWVFVPAMLVSIGAQLLAVYRKKDLPSYFQQPVEVTGYVLTALVLVLTIPCVGVMSARSFAIVFLVAFLQYAIFYWQTRRIRFQVAARLLLSLAIVATGYDISQYVSGQLEAVVVGIGWLSAALVQQLYSLVRGRKVKSWIDDIVLYTGASITLLVSLSWMVVDMANLGAIAAAATTAAVLIAAGYFYRRVDYYYGALVPFLVLPFTVAQYSAHFVDSSRFSLYLSLYFVASLLIAIGWYWLWRGRATAYRVLTIVAFLLHGIVGLIVMVATLANGLGSEVAWLYPATAALMFASIAYGEKQPYQLLIAVSAALSSVIWLLYGALEARGAAIGIIAILLSSAVITVVSLVVTRHRNQHFAVAPMIAGMVWSSLALLVSALALNEQSRLIVGAIDVSAALTVVISVFMSVAVYFVLYHGRARLTRVAARVGMFVTLGIATITIHSIAPESLSAHLFVLAVLLGYTLWRDASSWQIYAALPVFAALLPQVLTDIMGSFENWMHPVTFMTMSLGYLGVAELLRATSESRRGLANAMSHTAFWIGVVGFVLCLLSDFGMPTAFEILIGMLLLVAALERLIRWSRKEWVGNAEIASYLGATAVVYIIARLADHSGVTIDLPVYAHIYALSIIAAGMLYKGVGRTTRFIVAAGLVTLSMGVFALYFGGVYQLVYLFEHAVLLLIGVITGTKWAAWWGAVAVTLSVMYMLRDVQYLALFAIGIGLIGFVVWRLSRPKSDGRS